MIALSGLADAVLSTVSDAIVAADKDARTARSCARKPKGDLIAAPAGMEAPQIVNTSSDELRFLAISTMGAFDVGEYPGHVAVGIKNADFRTATYKGPRQAC